MGVDRFTVEIEPEVRDWLIMLPARHRSRTMRAVDLLADYPTTLGEPYSRHLYGPLPQKTCESEQPPAHEEFSRTVGQGEQW
ncbi:hypothetical protein [Kitasatospora sp. NPDC094011]|uniref:hypothetical protein n=1 Tax=Kitasatospora sp. NPDC094011 TaxID=3364090 RepID=UPI003819E561